MAIAELFYQVQVIYGRSGRVVPMLVREFDTDPGLLRHRNNATTVGSEVGIAQLVGDVLGLHVQRSNADWAQNFVKVDSGASGTKRSTSRRSIRRDCPTSHDLDSRYWRWCTDSTVYRCGSKPSASAAARPMCSRAVGSASIA
jgi:hypothetical protein